MSGNHNGSLKSALKIIESAAEVGANAIKLQTYTPKSMTVDSRKDSFKINDPKNLWKGRYLYDLFEEAQTPFNWHDKLFKRASELGIDCFSSPFDTDAVDFLESLNCPAYKVASFENNDLKLLRRIAQTNKPIIISVGMASISGVELAIQTVREINNCPIALLKCTSNYPADPKDSNIATIRHLRDTFNCEVGISDHTKGIGVSIASIGFGSTIIEKHFTLDKKVKTVDSEFSLDPKEFGDLVTESQRAKKSIGSVQYGNVSSESNSVKFKRSLIVTKEIKKGEPLGHNNYSILRPNLGLDPKFYDIVFNKRVNRDLSVGDPVTWDVFG